MSKFIKRYIAIYHDEVAPESGEYGDFIPTLLTNESGETIVSESIDEIEDEILKDIEYWKNQRLYPNEVEQEYQNGIYKVYDAYNMCTYVIKEIELKVEV